MEKLQISIIIATWNAAETLRDCLDSVVPQLTDETELLIIDGGSMDDTMNIVESYGSKIAYSVSEKDNGIYDAWNKGVKAAKGQWIMFVGADDKLEPDALGRYIHFLSGIDKDVDFISSKIKYVDSDGTLLALTGNLWNYSRCRINMDVTHVASLTNRNYFERVGLFDVDYKIVGDYELLLRGGRTMKPAFMNAVVAIMSIGGASFSVKGLKEQFKVKRKTGNVAFIYCCLIYCVQLFLFYTYKFRHRKKW